MGAAAHQAYQPGLYGRWQPPRKIHLCPHGWHPNMNIKRLVWGWRVGSIPAVVRKGARGAVQQHDGTGGLVGWYRGCKICEQFVLSLFRHEPVSRHTTCLMCCVSTAPKDAYHETPGRCLQTGHPGKQAAGGSGCRSAGGWCIVGDVSCCANVDTEKQSTVPRPPRTPGQHE